MSAVSVKTILELHRLVRGEIWDAGRYKDKESDIVKTFPNGRRRIRFRTVRATQCRQFLRDSITMWRNCQKEAWVHPLLSMAAYNLDFLCIHPFRDGNGRVSRLLLLLQCYHIGYEVGRYISLERIIEQNKERYYETLEESSRNWHQSSHDPWPYINYLLFILKSAYREFEDRLGALKSPRGEKTRLVAATIASISGEFTLTDLERSCPGVSRDMIRRVLRTLKKENKVECLSRGPGAQWRKKG